MSLEGKQIDHYRVIRLLGKGTIGEVYLAEDLNVARQVAIKVVQVEASLRGNEKVEDVARLFRRKMSAITNLDHPNILTIFDVGETVVDGTILIYMVMQYRPEGSLLVWLRQNNKKYPLTQEETGHFISQAAGALQDAHEHGIWHLDVKPANFLVRNSRGSAGLPNLLLTNFGISKIIGTRGSMFSHGTLAYTAPEQWNNVPVAASDQYSLAVMTYEFLTGRVPFEGNMTQVIYQHIHVDPVPPSKFQPSLNSAIDAVLLRALNKKPEDRFPSIDVFSSALLQAFKYYGLRATVSITPDDAKIGTICTVNLPGRQRVHVMVPAGAYEEQVLLIEEEGTAYYDGGPKGPLFLTVAIEEERDITVPTARVSMAALSAVTFPPEQASALYNGNSLVEKPIIASGSIASFVSQDAPTLPLFSEKRENASPIRVQSMVIAFLAMLLIVTSIFGFGLYQNHTHQLSVAATTQANMRKATSTAIVNATTTSQALDATATIITSNFYPTYLPGQGTLSFADLLNQSGEWSNGLDNAFGGECKFVNGTFHVSQVKANKSFACSSSDIFTNFAFEVHMTILNGDCGVIGFREDDSIGSSYDISICQSGTFALYKYLSISKSVTLDPGGPITIEGNDVIDVFADSNFLKVYVNGNILTSTSDSSLNKGVIALGAEDDTNTTEVSFTDAKLWTL